MTGDSIHVTVHKPRDLGSGCARRPSRSLACFELESASFLAGFFFPAAAPFFAVGTDAALARGAVFLPLPAE